MRSPLEARRDTGQQELRPWKTCAFTELTAARSRLLRMLENGAFPIEGAPIPPRRGAPRVGDGVVELDDQGVVQWASPNALSAFHRFGIQGDMAGTTLAEQEGPYGAEGFIRQAFAPLPAMQMPGNPLVIIAAKVDSPSPV